MRRPRRWSRRPAPRPLGVHPGPGSNGSNGYHPEDQNGDHNGLVPPGPRSLMPDRDLAPEDHWSERSEQPLVPDFWAHPVQAAKRAAHRAWYTTRFQATRTPIYAARNFYWSPRGAYRLIVSWWRWVTDYEASRIAMYAAEQKALADNDPYPVLKVRADRRATVKPRQAKTALGLLGLAGLGYLVLMDPVLLVPLVPALVLVLGYTGRPADRPYIESTAVSAPDARVITPDMVLTALHAAGLCKETTGPMAPKFVTPVCQEGDGYAATVDLPYGYTAEKAIKRKVEIAGGLDVDEFRLFLERVRGDRGHARRLKLWVANSDPHTRKAKSSPLVKANKFDLWQPVPFGTDERGKHVAFKLVWTSVLIGSLPRMGKSNAMRVLLSAAALDPYTKLIVFDGKGGKDFAALEQVCHAFGAGADDDVAAALVAQLTELRDEMRARFKTLRKLPNDICPQAKVTPGITHRRDLNMPLVVVAIDEFQEYLENKKYGKVIEELLTKLIKVGPSAGIILVCATQRPSSKIMETDFRDVFGTRFALMVTTREFSEMILGSGAYALGLDASKLLRTHLGVGILRGTDDGELADQGGRTVHAYIMDLTEFSAICTRARALREGAGTLTGVAAGEEPEVLSDHFLPHVIKAFRGETQAHSDVLCSRLAEDYPGLYADPDTLRPSWDPNDLAIALNRYGVQRRAKGVWAPRLEDGEATTRKGFVRDDIEEAAAKRTPPVPHSPAEWTD